MKELISMIPESMRDTVGKVEDLVKAGEDFCNKAIDLGMPPESIADWFGLICYYYLEAYYGTEDTATDAGGDA